MKEAKKIYYLQGVAQHYDWGGNKFIPSIIPSTAAGDKPIAEYWLGAHQSASSEVISANPVSLEKLVAENPEQALGKTVAKKFGRLPYLLKLLDVKKMLSIQVHPSKKEAEKDFARENAEGIPLNAHNRNYKDDNHKPELMVAMSDFWLIHGFKPEKELATILSNVVELKELLPVFNQSGYAGLYKYVMEMPQPEVNSVLKPLLDRIIPLYKEEKLNRLQEDFWAARAAMTFDKEKETRNKGQEVIDRGIFSLYFFNLLHLKKGEGIFQDAGVPHAYLEGQNVEIMANSDNVLRGGLTVKHIDVKELLKHIKFEAARINILTGKNISEHEFLYETPAPDFRLSVFHLQEKQEASFVSGTAEILLLTDGVVQINNGADPLKLERGKASAIVFAGQKVNLSALEKATVFRASVPVHISA